MMCWTEMQWISLQQCRGETLGEVFYNPMIWYQSPGEPVSLDCESHWCFPFFSLLMWHRYRMAKGSGFTISFPSERKPERGRVGFSPGWEDSDKTLVLSGKIVSTEVRFDEETGMLGYISKCFLSSFPFWKLQRIFHQYFLWEPRALGGKPHKCVCTLLPSPHYWISLEWLTLRVVHTELPAICGLQFRCSYPGIGSCRSFCSGVSILESCDSLHPPTLHPIWGSAVCPATSHIRWI